MLNVIEFVDQGVSDCSPANGCRTEHQSDDQHQFCLDDETIFVVKECARHGVCLSEGTDTEV